MPPKDATLPTPSTSCARSQCPHDFLAQTAGLIAGSWHASPATHVGHEWIAAGMLILAAKVIHWTIKSLGIGLALSSSKERRFAAVSGKGGLAASPPC
jgi:hypothetical protein